MNFFVPNPPATLQRIQIELDVVMNALAIDRWTLSYWIGGMYNKYFSRHTKTILFYYTTNRKK